MDRKACKRIGYCVLNAVLVALLVFTQPKAILAQNTTSGAQTTGVTKLKIKVIGGKKPIDNLSPLLAREMVVEVRDQNNKPVANAAVVFGNSQSSAGTFPNGSRVLSTVTDQSGRAVASGFTPTTANFSLPITASVGSVTTAAAAVGAAAGISMLTVGIIVGAAAAAAAGAAVVVKKPSKTSVSLGGTPTVGAPSNLK